MVRDKFPRLSISRGGKDNVVGVMFQVVHNFPGRGSARCLTSVDGSALDLADLVREG